MESDLSSLPPSSPPPEEVKRNMRAKSCTSAKAKPKAPSKSQKNTPAVDFDSEFSDALTALSDSDDEEESEFDGGATSADEGRRSVPKSKAKAKAKAKPTGNANPAPGVGEETDSELTDEVPVFNPAEAAQNVGGVPSRCACL